MSWHQDSTYWGVSTPDVVTAWFAFTPRDRGERGNGVRPRQPQARSDSHRDTFARHHLLTRGQPVMVEVDRSQRRIITLRRGEMSLHHVRLVHGSPHNPSDDRRIGFAIL